jgi:hypothetical protein
MSDSFGHDLLAAIESKMPENIVFMKQLKRVVQLALGIPEDVEAGPPVLFQQPTKGEFPQWRVRYDPLTRKEIDRRAIRNMGELQELSRECGGLFHEVDSCTPVPPREG